MNHALLCGSISLEIGTSKCYNRRAEPSRGPRRRLRPRLRTGTRTAKYASRATPEGRCDEDSDEQATPPLSRAGAATRRRAGHASFLPGWRCSNDEQATPPVSRAGASTGTATSGLSRDPRRRLRPRLRTGTRTGTRAAPLPKDPRSSQTWSHCVWVCVGCSARCRALVFLQV